MKKQRTNRLSMSYDRMHRQPPTVTLVVSPDRAYMQLLQQTKIVYDQLLADKHSKLFQALMVRKTQYDDKCTELLETNEQKAMEFGVVAQDAINKMCSEFGEELMALRKDYQEKMNGMYSQLEDKWKDDQAKNAGSGVQCQVYPHK